MAGSSISSSRKAHTSRRSAACIATTALACVAVGIATVASASSPTDIAPKRDVVPVGVRALTYPPSYRTRTGKLVQGLVATSLAQMTSLVPDPPQVSGVVVPVYWSVLEPHPGKFRWTIIDHLLRYWSKRKKMVVLSPIIYGNPVRFPAAWGGLQDGFPSWLRGHGRTLAPYRAQILGGPSSSTGPVAIPIPDLLT